MDEACHGPMWREDWAERGLPPPDRTAGSISWWRAHATTPEEWPLLQLFEQYQTEEENNKEAKEKDTAKKKRREKSDLFPLP